MDKQTVIFDLDDTLIHCNKYFNDVLRRFAEQMQRWFPGIPEDVILRKQLEFDLEGVHRHGFKKERFPLSLIETYDHFCQLSGKKPILAEKEWLFELGHDVYEQQFEPYPHMRETLEILKERGSRLCLFTGGDPLVQKRKIEQLDLHSFFEQRIYIVQHKNTTAMRQVVRETGGDPLATWMVGNSARTDILPALEAGIHAIHIPNETEWEYNRAEINVKPRGVFVTLRSLKEVPESIERYRMRPEKP
jgi:putative hydrolase of the HAD superfamily